MRRFGGKFVKLGEIVEIRRGITSGCDAFFMPKEITEQMLEDYPGEQEFRRQAGGASRKDVEAGRLKIVEAGDGSIHPIESQYLAPEVHSLMKVDRPIIRASDIDRVVLLAGEPMEKLKKKSPWVWRYLQYGSQATFESSKSRPVPVPKRSTCAARNPWYDLTRLVRPGIAFWPMAQKYRHIVPTNPESLICNHNLFDISGPNLTFIEKEALCAILNSTIIGFFKAFYGRFAGTETTLKTEVVDVGFIDVPNPKGISSLLASKIIAAFKKMQKRESGHLLSEELINCHSAERAREIIAKGVRFPKELLQEDRQRLDNCVFELLGVLDSSARRKLANTLYEETSRYFQEGRAVELQAMENGARSNRKRINPAEIASDIWDALVLEDVTPLREWIESQPESDTLAAIPEERPVFFPENPLFELKTVCVGKDKKNQVDYRSQEQAGLVFQLAQLGLAGNIKLPSTRRGCLDVRARLKERIEKARSQIRDYVESRTADERLQAQLREALERWYLYGRNRPGDNPPRPA